MRSNRLSAACGFAAVSFLLCVLSFAAQPNVVLIITDDHRHDALGAAGNTAIHTPALDRLAREGTYFRQATIHVPQCSPSRATLLTGLAPHQHGWFSNQAQQTKRADAAKFKSLPMVPSLLKEAGYRTVFVGKWHLAPDPWDCGFSDILTWLPPGGGPYADAELAHGNSRARAVKKGFTNQHFGDDAVAFLDGPDAKGKPFFLWLALTAPHSPIKPNPPDIEKLYEGKSKTDLMPPGFPKDRDAGDWQHYYEAVTMADRQIGNVLDALDRAKLSDNTIVIVLGDNGFMMGGRDVEQFRKNKPYLGKVFPYEDSVRVPMLIRGKGFTAGPNDAPVSSLDLPPTILASAGLKVPSSWAGRDLHNTATITEAFCEFADNESDKFGDIAYRLVRTPTHKLIVYETTSRGDELYAVKDDPFESKNLVNDPSARAIYNDLRQRLQKWAAQTNDPAVNWPNLSGKKGE